MDMHQGVAGMHILSLFHIYLHDASGQLARDAHLGGVGLSLNEIGLRFHGDEAYHGQCRNYQQD